MDRFLTTFLGAMVLIAGAVRPASAQPIPAAPSAAPQAAPRPAQPADAIAPYIRSIEQATDPSALISAYANGFAVDRTSLKLHEAYINRMVDFGMPEMAYHQAELAVNLNPRNGLVRGVLAYVDARRGLMNDALSEIVQAASLSPDQPFVQRTAGELLAWYDRNFLNVGASDSLKVSLDSTRSAMGSRAIFAQAYEDAKKALADQAAAAGGKMATPVNGPAPAATTQPSTSSAPLTAPAGAGYPQTTYVYSTGGTGYDNSAQIVDYQPAPYPDYYPWPYDWWWPSGVFFGTGCNVFFFGHHHHDHDGDADDAWRGARASHLFNSPLSAQQQLRHALSGTVPTNVASTNVGRGNVGVGNVGAVLTTGGTGAFTSTHGHTAGTALSAAMMSTSTSGAGSITSGVNHTTFGLNHTTAMMTNSTAGTGGGLDIAHARTSFSSGNLEPSSTSSGSAALHVAHVLSGSTGTTGSSGTTFSSSGHVTHVMPSGGGGSAGFSGGSGRSFSSFSSPSRFTSSGGGSFSSGGNFSSAGHFSGGFSGGHAGGGGHR